MRGETRFTLRLNDDILTAIQQRAAEHGRSVNAEIVTILERASTIGEGEHLDLLRRIAAKIDA